jgi:tetratricopeptide (TPR) repeat protein
MASELVYKTEEIFWTDTLAKNPDCWMGYNNLGNALLQNGEVDEALELFQKALEINPHFVDARSNLGATLFQKGQVDDAVAQYKKGWKSTQTTRKLTTTSVWLCFKRDRSTTLFRVLTP